MVERALSAPGQPLELATRTIMEARFGRDFSAVRVHTGAQAAESARSVHALAYTTGNDVVFGQGQYALNSKQGQRLLAHELTHVVQQSNPSTSTPVVLRKPDPLAPRHAVLVRRARARLQVLEPLLTALKIQSTRTAQERIDLLRERETLDATIVEPAPPGQRQAVEEAQLAQLNTRPLRIQMTDAAITFNVRFHVQFEDSVMGNQRYAELVRQMRAGIAMVWNHRLAGHAFGGREFRLRPVFTRIAQTAPRNLDHWLIRVRDRDTGVVTYPGCTLDATNPAIPTSVTSPTCDGGVMIIPPRHIANPSILGHETLHLFGLVDRYISFTDIKPGKAPVVRNQALRETGGRLDPLGTEDDTILREDLGFLFAHLGVYDQELSHLQSNIASIEKEVMQLREIVRLGRDPHSLIESVIPRDFTDRIIKSAEDI